MNPLKSLVLGAILLGSAAASATVVEQFDLPRLVKTADLIIVGEVLDAQPRWRNGRIVTTVRVRNDGAMKGAGE
jgi:glycerate kinase